MIESSESNFPPPHPTSSSATAPPPPIPRRTNILSGRAPSYHQTPQLHQNTYHPPAYGALAVPHSSANYLAASPYSMHYAVNAGALPSLPSSLPSSLQQGEAAARYDAFLRQQFRSIASLVETVNSLAHILNSTYSAMYGSLHSVFNVAGHIASAHSQLVGLARALLRIATHLLHEAVLRPVKLAVSSSARYEAASQAMQRILTARLLATSPSEATVHDDWRAQKSDSHGRIKPNWLLWVFCLIIIGGPTLMYRLIRRLVQEEQHHAKPSSTTIAIPDATPADAVPVARDVVDADDDERRWFAGKVIHPFRAVQPDELSVTPGELVLIAPKSRQYEKDWFRVQRRTASGEEGVVPASHIQVLGRCDASE